LGVLAGRLRKVDLASIDLVREIWSKEIDPVLAEHCHPDFIKNSVLVVSVPSGAFAQRVRAESPTILASFASMGANAPSAIKTVLK
jgi:predicted nucleic acid-binding Zn ribbon protein